MEFPLGLAHSMRETRWPTTLTLEVRLHVLDELKLSFVIQVGIAIVELTVVLGKVIFVGLLSLYLWLCCRVEFFCHSVLLLVIGRSWLVQRPLAIGG